MRTPAWPVDRHLIRLALAALAALVGSAVTMVWLHLGYADQISIVSQTVSYYVFPPGGAGLFSVSTLSLAVAVAVLAFGLTRAGVPCHGVVAALVVATTASLVLLVLFPTDETGGPLSFSGQIHRYAGVSLFTSVPLLGFVLSRRLRDHPQWSQVSRLLRRLSVAAGAMAIAFLISHVPVLLPDSAVAELFGGLRPHGLVERVLLAIEMAVVAVMTLGLLRVARPGGKIPARRALDEGQLMGAR